MHKVLQFVATAEDEGNTVRDVLQKKHGISRRLLVRAKFHGDVTVNGEPVFVTVRLHTGDVVAVFVPEEESETLAPEPMPLAIRYEDEDLMVLAKPAGIVVHPTRTHTHGTLANGVIAHWLKKGEVRKFRPVNRIDRDTSGLLIVAKNQWASEQCARLQRERVLKRTYQAVVHGLVAADEGVVDAPIGNCNDSIITRQVREDGKPALTRYRVVGRGAGMTWMELQLETGRTHQIRVHMSYLGHPLLGDDLYGGQREFIDRQALHAIRLSFLHPRTQECIDITEPLPEDIKRLISKMNEKNLQKDVGKM